MVKLCSHVKLPWGRSILYELDCPLPLLLMTRAIQFDMDVYWAATSLLIIKGGNTYCIDYWELQKIIIPKVDNIPQTTTHNHKKQHKKCKMTMINHCHLPCIAAVAAAILVSCCPIRSTRCKRYSPWPPLSTNAIRVVIIIGDRKGIATCWCDNIFSYL